MNRAKQANYILQDQGLLNELKQYGTPHIIGSYKMDLMAWNDLDIDVENDLMSLNKLHNLTKFILDSFNPTWYEAKEEVDKQGSKGWFQGFEFYLNKELWNVDIWFLNKHEIEKAEKWLDYFAASGRPTFQIVKLKVKGNVFYGDAAKCFDGKLNENENLILAEKYWKNDDFDELSVLEMLVDGDMEVVEIVKGIMA